MFTSAEIAERIKTTCKEKGITIGSVLEKAGLGRNTMANFKTSMPKTDTLAKIANVLNCSVEYLLGNTDEKEKNHAADSMVLSTDNDKIKEIVNILGGSDLSEQTLEEIKSYIEFKILKNK